MNEVKITMTKEITIHGLLNGSPVSATLEVDEGCKLFLNTSGGDVSLSEIPNDLEWNFETVETTGETFINPHIGGRPNDRK